MARQDALGKLRNHFSTQPTSNPKNEQCPPAEQTDRSNETQTQGGDLARLAERLDRIESNTVETLTNLLPFIQHVTEKLATINQKLAEFLAAVMNDSDQDRTHYTPAEFAQKAVHDGVKRHLTERTVQKWCREGRVKATKRESGRGENGEWAISRDEFNRWINEGLLSAED
jgi:hypothetical protein